MTAANLSLLAFALWAGLLSGFFFAWTNPAMMGFTHTSPAVYVEAMQHINRAVTNPYFAALFFGMVPVALAVVLFNGFNPLITLAAALCLLGIVVTIVGNVPMNQTMDNWDLTNLPPVQDIEAFRDRWQMLNTLRSLLCSLGFGLGLISYGASKPV
jgi:uncharacterized membrane protein